MSDCNKAKGEKYGLSAICTTPSAGSVKSCVLLFHLTVYTISNWIYASSSSHPTNCPPTSMLSLTITVLKFQRSWEHSRRCKGIFHLAPNVRLWLARWMEIKESRQDYCILIVIHFLNICRICVQSYFIQNQISMVVIIDQGLRLQPAVLRCCRWKLLSLLILS